MANNNNISQNKTPKKGNYTVELAAVAGAITTISDEITKIAAELSFSEVQRDNNINAINNLQKQIDFLSNEIKEMKKTMR
ncbi:hypothetical protein ACFX4I_02315 [Peribacillus sp. YIM B13472]|uniref:hypothetical protein n=1 Tax=Peribacillus sp. YIM B13472 TaxID=3366297 RepID=UPI00366F8658